MVGDTEQNLDGSALPNPLKFLDRVENDGEPAFITAAANPNTGKTNTMIKLLQMRKFDRDDFLIVSNVHSWSACDIHVMSIIMKIITNSVKPTNKTIRKPQMYLLIR